MIQITVSSNVINKMAYTIKDLITQIDNPDNYVLSLQLDYRDNNTIFYLKNVKHIKFEKKWLEIQQENNSHVFFDYKHILEYCVLNAEDVIDLGGL